MLSKRLIATFLLGLMLFSSVGVVINRHYCLGMLRSESLFGINADACSDHCQAPLPKSESEIQKEDCCEDEAIVIESLRTPRVQEKQIEQATPLPSLKTISPKTLCCVKPTGEGFILPCPDSSPPLQRVPVFVTNQQFLI